MPTDIESLDLSQFRLPEGFLFGVCNSPYHSEGGYNTPGGPHNNWSIWEQAGYIEPSGETNRFWTDWQQHIEKAASCGLNIFRMGFEWARMQPSFSPQEILAPVWDDSAFDHYTEIVASVYRAGMEPCITLHHFTHPAWIGQFLWTDDAKVELFVAYIRRAVEEINRRLVEQNYPAIRQYVVFNEPFNTLAGPYLFGDAPPGTITDDVEGFGIATMNLLTAYLRSYDIIHDLYAGNGWRKPMVGFNIVSYSVYELDKWYLDVVRARERGVPRQEFLTYLDLRRNRFNQVMNGLAAQRLNPSQWDYWNSMRVHYRQMFASFSYDRLLNVLYRSPRPEKLDYLAIDCYDPFIFAILGATVTGQPVRSRQIGADRFDWTLLEFDPVVTREHLRLHGQDANDLPLYILETTIGHNHPKFGVPVPRPDGLTVEHFLRQILTESIHLLLEGIPLCGFLYWTLCDNYEWGTFTSRLGLVEYDYREHVICDTDAFGAPNLRIYRRLIEALQSNDPQRIHDAFSTSGI